MKDKEYAICWKCKVEKFDSKGVAYEHGLTFFKCQSCDERSIGFSQQKATCHKCGLHWKVCVMCGGKLN